MWILLIKLILIALCGFLWRLGGSHYASKGIRRFGCAGLITLSAVLMRNWFGLISLPILILMFSLGYGGNSKLIRLLKSKYLVRFICGLAYSLGSIFILWNNWWLLGYHIGIVSVGVMLAGTQRLQFKNHMEEGFIGALISFCPVMS